MSMRHKNHRLQVPKYSEVDVVYFAEQMEYWPEDWLVIGYNDKTKVAYVTIFSAPNAEQRAKEYAEYKNGTNNTTIDSNSSVQSRTRISLGEDSAECGA